MSPESDAVLWFEILKEKIVTPKSEAVPLVCKTDLKCSNTDQGIT
jgi:hypothetical protein